MNAKASGGRVLLLGTLHILEKARHKEQVLELTVFTKKNSANPSLNVPLC